MAAASVLAGRGFWMLVVVFALLPHAERLSVLAITLEELHTAPDSFIPTSIAFGSCAKSHLNTDQELWHSVLRGKPDLWVWMGDNIYPNEDEDPNNPNKDLEEKRREYQRQSRKAGYRQLASEVAVVGVWDDHDYGGDDSGKDYPRKQASKDLLLEFLREPEDSPRRQRGGVYISYTLGAPGRQIKLILLDTRWFQDPPGESSSLLGSVQWDWLVQELQGTGQALNVLVSSIQVVNGDSIMSENWRQWPIDHSRLTNRLNQEDTPPTIILSGDRHYGEMARDCDVGADWGGLLEITSSGVTQHRPAKFTIFDCNPYRVTGVMDQINYGTLHVDWEEGVVSAHIHAHNNKLSHSLDKQ